MKKTFVKMHGLGNDFAVFEARAGACAFAPARIRALADRRRGIGFDQLVVIRPGNVMEIFNADGSEVAACGNATRCVARLLMEESGAREVTVTTKAGALACRRADGEVEVDMGRPGLGWRDIPLAAEADTLSLPLGQGPLRNPAAVSMGNPHAVFFVDDAAAVPLETLGPLVEHHPLFPARTNVEAVEVLSRDRLRMRVWERGTGITQACGTGACAAAVAAARRDLADRRVTVALDGGELRIEWRESDGHVLMTGAAETAYRGEIEA